MAKFHINPESGEPGECSAKPGNCPFGDDSDHYASLAQARGAFEELMSSRAMIALERKRLPADILVSVLDGEKDVLVEAEPEQLERELEPGEYMAYYYDEGRDEDRYIRLRLSSYGELAYEPAKTFEKITSPSSPRTKMAISELRTELNLLLNRSDPHYCSRNAMDRITLIEGAQEIRRKMAVHDWTTAEGAYRGKKAFEEIEWALDHDLETAKLQGKNEEIRALQETKRLVSSFLSELSHRSN